MDPMRLIEKIKDLPLNITRYALRLPSCIPFRTTLPFPASTPDYPQLCMVNYCHFTLEQVMATGQVHPEDVDFFLNMLTRGDTRDERYRLAVSESLQSCPHAIASIQAIQECVPLSSNPRLSTCELLDILSLEVKEIIQGIWYRRSWRWLKDLPQRRSLYSLPDLSKYGIVGKLLPEWPDFQVSMVSEATSANFTGEQEYGDNDNTTFPIRTRSLSPEVLSVCISSPPTLPVGSAFPTPSYHATCLVRRFSTGPVARRRRRRFEGRKLALLERCH